MPTSTWLSKETRDRVKSAIEQLEARSGAEVVATLSVKSGDYRFADAMVGILCSFSLFIVYILYPEPIYDDIALVAIIVSFGLGMYLPRRITGLRRLFTSKRTMAENVRVQARARFVDQGISVTSGRTGVLVFIALFERKVELVPDLGIDPRRLGQAWTEAAAALDKSVSAGPDAFLAALAALGPLLEQLAPRGEDDVNELPDEVVGA